MRNMGILVGVLVMLVGSAVPLSSAAADTVYLKNGRAIHSSVVQVDGDRVVVKQYAGFVAFPVELVDRVEENDRVEPGGYVPPQPEPEFDDVIEGDAPAEGDAAAEGTTPEEGAVQPEEGQAADDPAAQPEEGQAADDPAAQPDPPEDPRRDQAYWQGRLRPIYSQMDRSERERREYVGLAATSAEAQRQLDRIDRRLADLNRQAEAIKTEAHRLNVPPGWLRR